MRVRVHMCMRVCVRMYMCVCVHMCVCDATERQCVSEGVRERRGMCVCVVGVCVQESRTHVYVRRNREAVCWCGCARERGMCVCLVDVCVYVW